MANDTMTTLLLAAILACAPGIGGAEDELLRDPGFEAQLEPESGGWRLFGPSRFSESHARSGSWSMLNSGSSKTVAYPPYFIGTASGSYQEFPAEPGSRWQLTGYGFAPEGLTGAPAFGIVQISFFDADGDDLGTVETVGDTASRAKLSNEVNSRSPAGQWISLDTGVATAPEGAATVQAFTLFVDYSGTGRFQGVYFDDLRLCRLGTTESKGCSE